MNLNKLKIFAFCAGICVLLSGCETASPEVTDPPQKQASAIKSQGGVYKVGNPYKILGRWYYPKEDYSYSEVGIASWYGPDFHAKRTANGEKYNMHSLTAAHRTLPLPSIVKITNLENGRSLVVRVNDRGPYARNRIVDVSKKVAQLLGFLEKGTAKVRVEVLEKESKNLKAALTGEALSRCQMDTIILESFSQTAGKRYSQEMGNRFCKGYLYKGGTCIQYICLFPERRIYRRYMGEKRYCTTCEISVQCSSVN